MDIGSGITVATMTGRIAVVALGAAVLIGCLVASRRFFSRSFFHGFMVSSGVFLSFDIVVFHWLFRLHRITSGPEANVIEPLLVLMGIGFVGYGLTHENRRPNAPDTATPTHARSSAHDRDA
jgi:Predicted membrane protein (DUF2243)